MPNRKIALTKYKIGLIIVLVLSLFLTLWGIQGKGFTSGDSIGYYDAARTSLTVTQWIIHGKNMPLSQYMLENN